MTGSDRVERPLLLLPPSKGKASGGDGPAYAATLTDGHPLAAARRELLAALQADLPGLDDRTLARVAGVRSKDVAAARQDLESVERAPTLPAHRRYTGIVHGNAGLADLDPDDLGTDVLIVSALLGLADLTDPVPPYRLEFGAALPSIGGIGTWWRDRLSDAIRARAANRRVWDLLPGEHARMWDQRVRDDLDVIGVSFVRPDGRSANAARAKVCKGRVAAWLINHPSATPGDLAGDLDPGEGWSLRVTDTGVTATFSA
ncbi:MAG: peroxide stress protein YaaA [Nitriliruptor sp.]|nr:MAG: peroxide stress protein YaaA [Nitriliruptor sp.]